MHITQTPMSGQVHTSPSTRMDGTKFRTALQCANASESAVAQSGTGMSAGAATVLPVVHGQQQQPAESWYHHRSCITAQPCTPPAPPALASFTCMSFNMLADQYCRNFSSQLYRDVPPSCLKWEHRQAILLQELLHWSPDIIVLQEVEHFAFFRAQLAEAGYQGLWVSRGGRRRDGCATFWRESKFALMETRNLRFAEHSLEDNVALLVRLQLLPSCCVPRSREGPETPSLDATPGPSLGLGSASGLAGPGSGQAPSAPVPPELPQLVVSNTHICFDPAKGDVKLGQCRMLFQAVSELASAHGALALLGGDFNTAPHSPLYRFMSQGRLDLTRHCKRKLSGQRKGWGYKDFFRQQAAADPGNSKTPTTTGSGPLAGAGGLLACAQAHLAAWLTPALCVPHNGWGERALRSALGVEGAEEAKQQRRSSIQGKRSSSSNASAGTPVWPIPGALAQKAASAATQTSSTGTHGMWPGAATQGPPITSHPLLISHTSEEVAYLPPPTHTPAPPTRHAPPRPMAPGAGVQGANDVGVQQALLTPMAAALEEAAAASASQGRFPTPMEVQTEAQVPLQAAVQMQVHTAVCASLDSLSQSAPPPVTVHGQPVTGAGWSLTGSGQHVSQMGPQASEMGQPISGPETDLSSRPRSAAAAADGDALPVWPGEGDGEGGEGDGEPWASHPLQLKSTYLHVTGSEPAFTSTHREYHGTCDYLWYTSTPVAKALVTPTPQSARTSLQGQRGEGAALPGQQRQQPDARRSLQYPRRLSACGQGQQQGEPFSLPGGQGVMPGQGQDGMEGQMQGAQDGPDTCVPGPGHLQHASVSLKGQERVQGQGQAQHGARISLQGREAGGGSGGVGQAPTGFGLRATTVLSPPSMLSLPKGLPADNWGSDHIPLLAEFEVTYTAKL